MPEEFFDKHRLHHWHFGLFGTIVCGLVVLWGLTFPEEVNVRLMMIFTVAGSLFGGWALDDALWHSLGWKWLPGHVLHEWLKRFWIYSAIDGWLKKKKVK